MTSPRPSRRRYLQLGACVATAGLAGCLSPGNDDPPTSGFSEGFETGLDGWEQAADVPDDPNQPGEKVDWRIERSTELAAAGSTSLQYVLDGHQDDGTIWVQREVPIEAGRAYAVSMRAEAWSPSESFNTLAHLVTYAGADAPTAETSFPPPGTNSSDAGVAPTGGLREPLNQAEGWRPYAFTWETPTLEADTVAVAIGISAVWETELTYFVDDVTVTAVPDAE